MDITRFDDRSLKPVPRQSPIPRNTVACVERRGSGDPDAPTLFILSKNGTDLVISGPPLPKIPGVELLTDYEATVVLGNALLEYLEVLVRHIRVVYDHGDFQSLIHNNHY